MWAPMEHFKRAIFISVLTAFVVSMLYACNRGKDASVDATEIKSIVATKYGKFVGKKQEGIIAFKGIPYAKSPVGELRWKEPINLEPGDRTFEAFEYGKVAIQVPASSELSSFTSQGENCLTLNVWTSDITAKGKPVMVFIHGGSYGWGGATDPIYDGQNFVQRRNDVILVTIQYRLNILGFMDVQDLGGEEYANSANLGLLDQIKALQWVKENIAGFGGDPGNVTIFGESCGGGSVSLLMTMPEAKGLFHKVISQSGAVNLSQSKANKNTLRKFLEVSGKSTMKDILAIGEEEMRFINFKMEDAYSFPVRDGKLIPKDPYRTIQSGSAEGVKLLIGTNANEWNYWKQEMPDFENNFPIRWEALAKNLNSPEINKYMRLRKEKSRLEQSLDLANDIGFRIPSILMAEDQSGHGDTYMYYFKWPSSIEGMGACHAVELAFVFHNISGPATIYTGPNPPEALADMIQDAWVNFAKTGNPGIEGVAWPKYDKKTRATMFIDKDKWEVVSDPGSEDRKLLEDICRKNIDLH